MRTPSSDGRRDKMVCEGGGVGDDNITAVAQIFLPAGGTTAAA